MKMNFKNLLSLFSMDFPSTLVESETDRRKVHELASRSMGVRERERIEEHVRCQNANLSMSNKFTHL
jgi:hypothetical protein